jgi:5-methyltetrahydrofolate--homocysteine methyltransferase
MNPLLEKIAICVERGKVNIKSPYPPDLKGQEGADELARKALDEGLSAKEILSEGLMVGMQKIGVRFRDNKVFVPDVLMAAKAMNAAMEHLKPYFASGEVQRKGTVIMGTVKGDLHDIGKKLVSMIFEGGGWEVIDLGVDVPAEKFLKALQEHPKAAVGMSALLTTTMINMESIVREIKKAHPQAKVMVGGAPLTQDFAVKIGADAYSADPQGALEYLNGTLAA